MEQEHPGSGKVATCQYLVQALVVSGKPAKPRRPGIRALYHPAAGQEHKPALDALYLHYFQLNPVFLGGSGSVLSGISLVDERLLHRVFRGYLRLYVQFFHVLAVLLVGGTHFQRERVAHGVGS